MPFDIRRIKRAGACTHAAATMAPITTSSFANLMIVIGTILSAVAFVGVFLACMLAGGAGTPWAPAHMYYFASVYTGAVLFVAVASALTASYMLGPIIFVVGAVVAQVATVVVMGVYALTTPYGAGALGSWCFLVPAFMSVALVVAVGATIATVGILDATKKKNKQE